MEVLGNKVKNFLGLGGGGGSRKRALEEEDADKVEEREQGLRPSKRLRREGPTPEHSPEVAEKELQPGLGQRIVKWIFGGWKTAPSKKAEVEKIQAPTPALLTTKHGETEVVEVTKNDTQEFPSEIRINNSSGLLSSFSGFSGQDSPRSSPGYHIRTSHEKARHEVGNSPANLRRGLKAGVRSSHDNFFSEKSLLSRSIKKKTGKTAFSYTSQMADKELYRRVLENFSCSSARSRSSIIKSPPGNKKSSFFFPSTRQNSHHRPLFGRTSGKPDDSQVTTSTSGKPDASHVAAPSSPNTSLVTSTAIKSVQGSSRLVQETSSPVLLTKVRKEDVEVVQELQEDTSCPVYTSNTLEHELLSRDVYSPSFLARLREKYDSSSREKKLRDKLKKGHIETKNVEVQADVNDRLKNYLHITQVVLEEPSLEKEEEEPTELPEITEEMDVVIRNAGRSKNQVLVDAFKIQITGKDIATLRGLNWLNDEVINFYMQMIVTRSGSGRFQPVYAFSTFFYPKLMESGHSGVKRWTKKVDVFGHSLILVPVHLGMHWCLATVDVREKTINYYDSMGGNNTRCLKAIEKYLEAEHLAKKSAPLDLSGWTKQIVKDIPQQMNGSDCGMFACKFAEYLSRRAKITFSQSDMPYFRKRMIWEIVKNTLLHP